MKRLIIYLVLFAFAFNLAFAGDTITVCSTGCEFEDLNDAMVDVNGTNSTVLINSSGSYSMEDTVYTMYVVDEAIRIDASDVNIDCNNALIEGNGSGNGIFATGERISLDGCRLNGFSRGFEGENLFDSIISNFDIDGISGKGILFNTADNNSVISTLIESGDYNVESTGDGTHNYIIDSEIDINKINALDGSTVALQWYLEIKVIDSDDNNIDGAEVNVTNNYDDLVGQLTTDSEGKTSQKAFSEYEVMDDGETYFNNYTIYAAGDGERGFAEITLDSSMNVEVVFDLDEPDFFDIVTETTNETVNVSFETDKDTSAVLKYWEEGNPEEIIEIIETGSEIENLRQNHFFEITELESDNDYSYNFTVCNYNNKCSESDVLGFRTNRTIDTVAPVILGVSNSTDNESITIDFETDKNANYSISFGANAGDLEEVIKDGNFSQDHSVFFDGLDDDTVYYYEILVCNVDNYCSESDIFEVRTNSTLEYVPPEITFSRPSESNNTLYNDWINRRVRVNTNEESTCVISGSSSGINFPGSELDRNGEGTEHTILFNSTTDGEGLFVEVSCTDVYSNENNRRVSFAINDTTLPRMSFSSKTIGNNRHTNQEDVTIYVVSDEELGRDPRININGESNSSMNYVDDFKYNYTFSDLPEGRHRINVYGEDLKGNVRKLSRTFYTDYTAPEMDVEFPDEDYTFDDTNILEANLTLSEKGECDYELLYIDQVRLERCEERCDERYDRCMDRADTSGEEQDCQDDLEECEDDCDDDKYRDEDDGEIEIYEDVRDCKDNCEDKQDKCEDDCLQERNACYDDYSDRSICRDDYDACEEDCKLDKDDCFDDCDKMDFTYYKNFDRHLRDGDYMLLFACRDEAGNEVEGNVSFSVEDTTPPRIVWASPNATTITGKTAHLRIETSEMAICRYCSSDVSFDDMKNDFGKISQEHGIFMSDLEDGEYNFYVRCNDTSGNVMGESFVINFNVTDSDAEDKDDKEKVVSKRFSSITANDRADFEIDDDEMVVRVIELLTNEDVSDVELIYEELKEQDLVETPENEVYTFFTLSKEGLDNDQIDTITVKFRVSNRWLEMNDIDEVYLESYSDRWEVKNAIETGGDDDYTYYQVDISHLSMFSITGKSIDSVDDSENVTEPIDPNETADEVPDRDDGDEDNESDEPETDRPDEVEEINFSSTLIWILLLGVLVVGGGAVAFYVYGSNRHPQHDQNATALKQPTQDDAAAGDTAAATPSGENLEQGGDSVKDRVEDKVKDKGSDEEPLENKSSKNNEVNENMPGFDGYKDDPVANYVIQARQAGQSVEDIMNALISAGHSSSVVQDKLAALGLINDEVKDYIIKALGAGYGESYVKESLLQNGFEKEMVEMKISEVLGNIKNEAGNFGSVHDNNSNGTTNNNATTTTSTNNNSDMYYSAELKDYVEKAAASGMKEADVRNALLSVGHDKGVVEYAISNYMSANGSSAPETESDSTEDSDKELLDYIQQCFDSGLSKFHIKKILKKSGYEKKEIKEAFKKMGK